MKILFSDKIKNEFDICEDYDYLFKYGNNQKMDPAWDEILGHISDAYFATGPVMALPFVYPLLLTITPALSSQ